MCYVKPELISEEICKLAILQNYKELKHVKKQTDEICKLFIQQDYRSLRYVKKQTFEICNLEIEQDMNAYIDIKSKLIKNEIYKLYFQKNNSS